MATVKHAPHIRNVQAGNKNWDPMHASIFEVSFAVPKAISGSVNGNDIDIITIADI